MGLGVNMDFQKKNFEYGQKVRIVKTNGSMDGIEGIVTGIASINWFDVYIVTLDKVIVTDATIMPKFSTVSIPETCLQPIA